MSDNTARIQVKIGSLEIDYEGNSSFLDEGLEQLLETMATMVELFPKSEVVSNLRTSSLHATVDNVIGEDAQTTSNMVLNNADFTTGMLASHSNAQSAPDLALCAMAYLELKLGQKPNSSKSILTEMKTATAIFKSQMSKNNSANLKSLAKSTRINETGVGKFSLAQKELDRFEGIIAEF